MTQIMTRNAGATMRIHAGRRTHRLSRGALRIASDAGPRQAPPIADEPCFITAIACELALRRGGEIDQHMSAARRLLERAFSELEESEARVQRSALSSHAA